jgi:hypothetical protein
MKKIPHLDYRTHGGKYQMTEPWEYRRTINGAFERVLIPTGHATNGASIPRFFWWLLSPFDPRYMEEATIHDHLCNQGQYQRADAWFEQLLIDNDEIARWHRKVFIASVKGWHWLAYQDAGYFKQAQPRYWLRILILNKRV